MMIPCYLYNYENELGIIDTLKLFSHSTNNYYFVSSLVNGRYPYSLSPTPYYPPENIDDFSMASAAGSVVGAGTTKKFE